MVNIKGNFGVILKNASNKIDTLEIEKHNKIGELQDTFDSEALEIEGYSLELENKLEALEERKKNGEVLKPVEMFDFSTLESSIKAYADQLENKRSKLNSETDQIRLEYKNKYTIIINELHYKKPIHLMKRRFDSYVRIIFNDYMDGLNEIRNFDFKYSKLVDLTTRVRDMSLSNDNGNTIFAVEDVRGNLSLETMYGKSFYITGIDDPLGALGISSMMTLKEEDKELMGGDLKTQRLELEKDKLEIANLKLIEENEKLSEKIHSLEMEAISIPANDNASKLIKRNRRSKK